MSVKRLFEILSASGRGEMRLVRNLRDVAGFAGGALAMAEASLLV